MRHTALALESVLLVACCCPAATAEESRVRWWPFGDQAEATPAGDNSLPAAWPQTGTPSAGAHQAPSATVPSTTAPTTLPGSAAQHASATDDWSEELPERRWMIQSPMAKISWPRIHLPALPKPHLPRPQFRPQRSEVDEARNAWVQKNPDPSRPSPLQAVKQGAQRVGESTRSAWRKTVDVLTPGDNPTSDSSRIARRETQSPFWKRMFGGEEPQPEGPRTVTEWMAQDRLDP